MSPSFSPRLAVYCRVSTDEQRERQTIRTQIEAAEQYIVHNSLTAYDFYTDDGVSGTIPLEQRPDGARLLADAKEGKFGIILLRRLDRLGRDPLVTLQALEVLQSCGLEIRSMTEHLDLDTPQGRLMTVIQCGMNGYEREITIQRSIEGTARLAKEGVWLGGIVPYGYRVEGQKKDARLVVSNELLPGFEMSEADVVRLIFRMAVEEHQSCFQIADCLNQMGILTVYARDNRPLLRGKRKVATAGIWRPARVRSILTNQTYMGIHEYGKRSKKLQGPIRRSVPAIVSAEVWHAAQRILKENLLWADRNSRREYLLRGQMKCRLCGLTYVGWVQSSPDRRGGRYPNRRYYTCNGKIGHRLIHTSTGQKCSSRLVPADFVEQVIWSEVESFLRNPGDVLGLLMASQGASTDATPLLQKEQRLLQERLGSLDTERMAILGLFRKGRIDEDMLNRQLDEIGTEEKAGKARLGILTAQLATAKHNVVELSSAEQLLRELNRKLDQPLTIDLRRQILSALVKSIGVETTERDGKRDATIHVTYRFAPIATHTGTDFLQKST
jgi:site-specific DNA recombinase